METTNRGIKELFIDLETFGGDKPSLDEVKVPSNYKNSETIEKYKQENLDSQWRKQALDPLKAQIICLSYAIDDGDVKSITGSEVDILSKFTQVLAKLDYFRFIGHNIIKFDLPMIYLRSLKYKLGYLKSVLPEGIRDDGYYDTMNAMAYTLYGKDGYISLKNACAFFGIEAKDDMDGSMVHDAYLNGEIKKIAEYCNNDVEATRKLYNHIEF